MYSTVKLLCLVRGCGGGVQTYLLFRAAFAEGCEKHQAGSESLETRMVSAAEVPWDEVRPRPIIRFLT